MTQVYNQEQFEQKVIDFITAETKKVYGRLWSATGGGKHENGVEFDVVLQKLRVGKKWSTFTPLKKEYTDQDIYEVWDRINCQIPSLRLVKHLIAEALNDGFRFEEDCFEKFTPVSECMPFPGAILELQLKDGVTVHRATHNHIEVDPTTLSGGSFFFATVDGKTIMIEESDVLAWKMIRIKPSDIEH